MQANVPFLFRNQVCYCSIYIDASTAPCYVFVFLLDKNLIEEFGTDITIKTDMESRLPRKDDITGLAGIREAIFQGMKSLPVFIEARDKYRLLA
ncbi:MAG: hypothetical protein EOP49_11405 [Sphingobacteriales bacterium]|nr:MAG: hypothetical protein EOP49_11405 [Sphingobacteriales bacterium]